MMYVTVCERVLVGALRPEAIPVCACDKGGTGGSEGGWGRERDELRMAEGWGSQRQREVEGGKQSEQPAELRAS